MNSLRYPASKSQINCFENYDFTVAADLATNVETADRLLSWLHVYTDCFEWACDPWERNFRNCLCWRPSCLNLAICEHFNFYGFQKLPIAA